MDSRRWHSPAPSSAAAEAEPEEEGAGVGGAGGPSRRRPPRRGLHRASPYGLGPRRWLPNLPVACRILPALSRDAPAATASDNNQLDQHKSLEVTHEMQSQPTELNNNSTAVNNTSNLLVEGDCENRNDGNDLAEIENIIKRNHFSRDETERLIEIIRSRTPDLCNEEQRVSRSLIGFEASPFSDKWSTPAKQVDIQSPSGTDFFTPSNVLDVASSPIELAKAYMEAQTSAFVVESRKRKFRALSHGVEMENSSSKIFPKVATDSPICWPGSVVGNYPNYLTPQSSKGRTLPPTSSRTAYAGSLFQRSRKHTGNHDAYNNSSGRPQLSTPFLAGSKSLFEEKVASTGGVLGSQPSTYSKGAYGDTVGATTPFFSKEASAVKRYIGSNLQEPHGKDTMESGSTPGRVPMVDNLSHYKSAALSVHPKSSKTANKILQHLERTIPAPTAKPLELMQASAKRTTPVVTNIQHNGPDSITSNSHRQSIINENGSAQQEISDANKVLVPPSSSNAQESSRKIQNSGSKSEITAVRSSQHPSKSDSSSTSAAMVLDKSTGNGFTFTFPVPKTAFSLAEPPATPTLSVPPSIPLADNADTPKYTIGSSSTANNLVFSFDSVSSSHTAAEEVPTYNFGSDKKRELSFDVAGKDAVCF